MRRRRFLGSAALAGLGLAGCRGSGGAGKDGPAAAGSKDRELSRIAACEELFGVDYTSGERQQMTGVLEDQLEHARALRRLDLEPMLPPATTFRPLESDERAPKRDLLAQAPAPKEALPAGDEAIAFAPVSALGRWLRSGALSSERLTSIYLERLDRLGSDLFCVAKTTRERALKEARERDAELAAGKDRGPLHGIPYGAKDLLDTAGVETGWGAAPYRGRIPDRDAVVVERLREAGAVLVAKLSLGALAYGDIWYGGRTRNPWNPLEGSAGSSAGSAAATAAGLVGFSLGTETMGSIVSPSMRCGTTGLRPTFGRVPRTGAMPLCWSLDKIGAITRTVEDAALVLSEISGADAGDPASLSRPLAYDGSRGAAGRRIGYDPAWFEGEHATEIDRQALAALREIGADLTEVALPDLPYSALLPILFAEAAASFEELTLSDRDDLLSWQDDEAWPNLFRAARFLSAVDHVRAGRFRRRVMHAMAEVFAGVELLVSPSFAGPLLTATNFTGHPALTLRAGFAERKPYADVLGREFLADAEPFSAPYGVTLWGRLFDEGTLCEVGRDLEQELAVWQRRPPLDT